MDRASQGVFAVFNCFGKKLIEDDAALPPLAILSQAKAAASITLHRVTAVRVSLN